MSNIKNILIDFADLLLELQKDSYKNNSVPFEVYQNELKVKCADAMEQQMEKVKRGYFLIIDELDAEERKKLL